jgi:hypothetical protein
VNHKHSAKRIEAVARAIYDSQDKEEWFEDFTVDGSPTFDGGFNCTAAAKAVIPIIATEIEQRQANLLKALEGLVENTSKAAYAKARAAIAKAKGEFQPEERKENAAN